VKTLKFWVHPAVIIGLWITASAFTLSELASVVPSLRSTRPQAPLVREAKQRALGARAQRSPVR